MIRRLKLWFNTKVLRRNKSNNKSKVVKITNIKYF